MEPLRYIQNFEQIKVLADSRRLAILRLLMAQSATLTGLGQVLGDHPARVRHHVKVLEGAGLIELVEQRPARGFIEKYYRATANAFMLQQMVTSPTGNGAVIIIGSHDLALELLADSFKSVARRPVLTLPVGSLEGLIALRQGLAHLAGCHLLDPGSGEFNLSYARHLFPDRPMQLVTLAHREQGLLTAKGNPKGIHGLGDLLREDVRLVNRNRGSGTRLWLDRSLQKLSIPPDQLRGYQNELNTHTAAAEAIASGAADVGLGLRAAAAAHHLDFIPLFEERFDLISPADDPDGALQPLFELLTEARFRKQITRLPGYATGQTGSLLFP